MNCDLVVAGGKVVDGSGAPAYHADTEELVAPACEGSGHTLAGSASNITLWE